MRRKIPGLVTMAGISVLLLVTAVGASDGVARPFHFWGQFHMVVHSGYAVVEGAGQATHMGRITMSATGLWGVFTGLLIASNGDEIFFLYSEPEIPQHGVFTIVGGTGRFEGASGQFESDVEIMDYGWGDDHYYVEAVLTGSGTIIY